MDSIYSILSIFLSVYLFPLSVCWSVHLSMSVCPSVYMCELILCEGHIMDILRRVGFKVRIITFVNLREGERERETERDRERERERKTERQISRERETERQISREMITKKDKIYSSKLQERSLTKFTLKNLNIRTLNLNSDLYTYTTIYKL